MKVLNIALDQVTMGSARGKVLVAMSGGVDSAVAAALLQQQGYDLVGVTLHLWDAEDQQKVGRCCSPLDRDDARRVCEHLRIPHFLVDERQAFRRDVVDPLVNSYLAGETPSPCVHCNSSVKLSQLVEVADRLGCDKIATGHYARLQPHPDGGMRLLRGCDRQKDQSYFLFGLAPAVLRRLVFPLGELEKTEARRVARQLALPNADKADSQELCFVPDGDVGGFVERQSGTAVPGTLRSADGRAVGTHRGVAHYTVGQRRGLHLSGDKPHYVLRILPETNDVIVGGEEQLWSRQLRATRVRWIGSSPSAAAFRAGVRIRYRHEAAQASITPTADGFEADFAEPQRAITPGQAAVLYGGEEVLGGGFIVA